MAASKPNLQRPEFPRSNGYDPDWVMTHQMGPNALWLVEWLCRDLDIRPGMRILDLGCGTAMTSIFMAREFGAHVWAADLWVEPDENWGRVREAGVADRVCPVKAEAHALPFAAEFFDVLVSVDAYQYFGTDDLYLGYVSRFVKPGGMLGVVLAGLTRDFEDGIPKHLTRPQSHGAPFWEDECICFHTASWWRALWERSKRVEVTVADTLADGWRYWRDFEQEVEHSGKAQFPSCAEALTADAGRYLGFVRLIGKRTKDALMNLYDPALITRMKAAKPDS
jgi:SAM-dependent methyltransferase